MDGNDDDELGVPLLFGTQKEQRELDEECVCSCSRKRAKGFCRYSKDRCPCCCCCSVKLYRVPELVLVVAVFSACLTQFLYTPFTCWAVSAVRNCLGGILFVLALIYLFVSSSFSMKATRSPESYYRWNNFRAIMSALTLISCIGFIAPTLILLPSVYNEKHLLIQGLGPSIAREPREVSVMDWMFKGLAVWGPYHSRSGSFRKTTVTYKSRIALKNGQTTCGWGSRKWHHTLLMDIHHPDALKSSRAPVIFHVHGGAYRWGDKSVSAWSFAYYLERGYAVVSPQYSLGCYGYSIKDTLGDLAQAFHYIQDHADELGLDGGEIHIVGDSAGGNLALNTAYSLKSSSIRSVMNNYGITNFNSFQPWWWFGDLCHGNGTEHQRLVAALAGGCTDAMFSAISPIDHITAKSPPTVTFIGTYDSLVSMPSQARDFHKKLTEAGVKNALVKIPTWDHVPELGFYGIPAQMQRYAQDRLLTLENN